MMFSPKSEAEATEIVASANAAHRSLLIEGGGTRAGLGRPIEAEAILSTRELKGITLYEPTELVLSARAGTPLTEINAALAEHQQYLAFEPMDHRTLFETRGESTVGGVVACNVSGSRRIAAGAARDHLLGLRFVNGRGEIVKSGGRVMKNVTGLDLVKLQCGAHGTLGLISEATFKVLPAPKATATLALHGLPNAKAVAALCAALGSTLRISGAAHLPAGLGTPEALTLLRLEGTKSSVAERLLALGRLLDAFSNGEALDPDYAVHLWHAVRDVVPLAAPRDAAIWRISIQPTKAPKLADLVLRKIEARHYYDWGGGLIWLSVEAGEEAQARLIRGALAEIGGGSPVGHASLVRAPDAIRRRVDVFEPRSPDLMKITQGTKLAFDPNGIINPGRMYAGV